MNPGTVIEHYKILSVLGEGGMGTVYKALDLKLERNVALKLLSSQLVTQKQFIERFKREAKNQAKLSHPNIVQVYGFVEAGNILGIVMEFVEGETLEKMINRKGVLALKESLSYLKDILSGVGYAHKNGFIHRDIKPSNIIINNEGSAKIMDFGISKAHNEKGLTKTGAKVGTIHYMSPEQIKSQEPTNQSDIYAIGITLFEMLTGKPPFDYGTEYEIMEAHLKKTPPRASNYLTTVPPEIDNLISTALNKQTNKRYTSCEQFLVKVNTFLEEKDYIVKHTEEKKKVVESPDKKKIKLKFFTLLMIAVSLVIAAFLLKVVTDFLMTSKGERVSGISDDMIYDDKVISREVREISFTSLNTGVNSVLNAIHFTDEFNGIVCGFEGTLLKTDDGGKSWFNVDSLYSLNFWDITFINHQRGFVVGEGGAIITTNDSGYTWQPIPSSVSQTLFKIKFINENTGFIVGNEGTILKTTNGGTNWRRVVSNSTSLLYSFAMIDDLNGFAVGWEGEIISTTNGGDIWEKQPSLSNQYLRDIDFSTSDNGVIVGGGGLIYTTSNGGKKWNEAKVDIISGLFSVNFIDEKNGFISGGRGELLLTNNSGKSWRQINSGFFTALNDIAVNNNKIYVAGTNGTILFGNLSK